MITKFSNPTDIVNAFGDYFNNVFIHSHAVDRSKFHIHKISGNSVMIMILEFFLDQLILLHFLHDRHMIIVGDFNILLLNLDECDPKFNVIKHFMKY